MTESQSIKDTLDVIRKALEEEIPNLNNTDEGVLVLNKLINDDGTINLVQSTPFINKEEVIKVLDNKLDLVFEKYFTKWLDNNLPSYLEKYFNNKKN